MMSSNLKDNEPSLPDQVSSALRKEILQDDQPSAESLIIFRLVNGYLSPHVAAIDLLATIAEAQDVSKLLITITTEIASLGIDYPTLHPNLIALISAIYDLPSLTSQRSEFLSSLSSSLGDLTQANYGHLFEDKSPGLIRDHMIANALYARLLNVVGHVQVPQERIFGLDDALFILSGALENEATAHEDPNIDVPTAAMYMIHAGKVFFEESKKGTGRDLATEKPLWNIRGQLWDGEPGLSVGRWKFWKTRFEVYASNQKLPDETKYFARMAVRTMDEVDQKEVK